MMMMSSFIRSCRNKIGAELPSPHSQSFPPEFVPDSASRISQRTVHERVVPATARRRAVVPGEVARGARKGYLVLRADDMPSGAEERA